ncbi:MAG: Asp-tRNA(Asn)/Glu-tRNA(Gln) amidotransferase subunit GatA [Calditrichaeota bacterium]|nr:MAG: Asp-tRNA(Asn)/Glu-tRNA(Gln) amidotransferase subunit GatA [Calditrichota bacterium]
MSETAIEKKNRFAAGEFYLAEAVEAYLARIEELRPLNAFIEVYAEEARRQAAEMDARRAQGKPLGKLAGLVLAIKDNICIKAHRVTCASRMLENFVSPYHATVIEKILAEDGLIIGKTNLDEFAMGSSTENSYFGSARNPVDDRRVAGGSSGGSAVAVAAGMADLALGSDTGGSIRQPAAFCGVVGLKPTYGRVSRYGLVAYASSLDQIGPFGKSVADVALLLQVIAGADPRDATCLPEPVPDYVGELSGEVQHLRVGLPKQYFQAGIDPEVKAAVMEVAARLEREGLEVRELDLPLTDYAIATYYIIATAEASSNLARYDGVRYGYRTPHAEDLEGMYVGTRSEGFGPEVKRRIMLGTYVLSAGYYEAYYKKAQQVRRLIKAEYDRALQEVDVLLTPTSPTPAFALGEKLGDPLQMYLSDIFTVTANLAGICAISLPCGTSSEGLPIGLQLIAGAFEEPKLLRLAGFIERLE